jgi:hypothetical protein
MKNNDASLAYFDKEKFAWSSDKDSENGTAYFPEVFYCSFRSDKAARHIILNRQYDSSNSLLLAFTLSSPGSPVKN